MRRLPSPLDVHTLLPLPASSDAFLKETQITLKEILNKSSQKKIFIVGPCSIHNLKKDFAYALKLKKIAEAMAPIGIVIMRVHVEKPRTKEKWKGFLYDPYLDNSNQLIDGILQTRRFLLELAKIGVPATMEILDPFAYKYYEDLLSYATIGARTSLSQIHRQIASDLSIPVGIKNPIDGNIEAAIQGIHFAKLPHTYLSFDKEGCPIAHTSQGNPLCHLILRGAYDHTNFTKPYLEKAKALLAHYHVETPLVIDCSHGNKIEGSQWGAFQATLENMISPSLGICGLMLESYLDKEKSLTDQCIGMEETKRYFSSAKTLLSLQRSTIGLNHI